MQIEGRNAVFELLRSEKSVDKIFIQEHIEFDTKLNGLTKKAKRMHVDILRRPKKFLDKMSQTGVHQGVIALSSDNHMDDDIVGFLESKIQKGETIRMVYIREAYHEYNIGAIIRSTECAGFDGVILPPKIQMNANIVRSSTGASEHIHIFNEALFPLLKTAKKLNIKTIAIERSLDAHVYSMVDLTGDLILIIGGEDRSLSEEITSKCDDTVFIPMKGKVNSLNMSVAAGVIIFDAMRQSNFA